MAHGVGATCSFSGPSSCLSCLKGVVSLDLYRDIALTKRAKERGYLFFVQGYVHEIKFHFQANFEVVEVSAKCFRSMKKSLPAHTINLIVYFEDATSGKLSRITESICSCVAG